MGKPEETKNFIEKNGVSWPMICDPGRQLYRNFGLKTATPLGLLSPSVALKAVTAMVQGHSVGLPVGDIRQLPGVFIIDTTGRIVYRYVGRDPADHPDAEIVLTALNTMTVQ